MFIKQYFYVNVFDEKINSLLRYNLINLNNLKNQIMTTKKAIKNKNQLMKELKEIDQISGYVETDQKKKVKKFHLEARLKEHYMGGDGFSPKQLEQLGLVMDSKIEPIRSDIKEIKNRLDHLEEDVTTLKNDMNNVKEDVAILKNDMKNMKQDISQINQRLDKIESCPTIQKEIINN